MRRKITNFPRIFITSLLLLLITFSAMAQNAVTGNVTDSKSGAALSGDRSRRRSRMDDR